MKTIVTVNTDLPSVQDVFHYKSGKALLDYDIIVFDPELPYESRIDFSGGGSCLSIEGTRNLKTAMEHWSREFKDAIKAGKTIFFLLNEYEIDSATDSYTTTNKNNRTYKTFAINNYEVLPVKISVRNANGKHLKVVDNQFKGLYDAIKDITQYKVVFTSEVNRKIFTTRDNSNVIASIMKFEGRTGNIVFLPYFDLSEMTTHDDKKEEVWTDDAMRLGKRIVGQLVEIDKMLRSESRETPKPQWLELISQPQIVSDINKAIQEDEVKIASLIREKESKCESRDILLQYTALLYETGKLLESVIEMSLELLGYKVQNFKDGDIEIDHIIISPDGLRMIGESEGKDSTAIDISKFRQLESNINEDFENDEIEVPAKGLLFGNGYRLIEPNKRKEQFTQKCLTNAKRLGTALIRTTDLYYVVLYIIDNPDDEQFKENCRKAIENTYGEIVEFPKP